MVEGVFHLEKKYMKFAPGICLVRTSTRYFKSNTSQSFWGLGMSDGCLCTTQFKSDSDLFLPWSEFDCWNKHESFVHRHTHQAFDGTNADKLNVTVHSKDASTGEVFGATVYPIALEELEWVNSTA